MPHFAYLMALSCMGILLGAVLPPLFFARDRLSVLLLTLAGFVIYWFPLAWVTAWGTAGDLPEEQRMTEAQYLSAIGEEAAGFAFILLACWLLRWLILGLLLLLRHLFRKRSSHTPDATHV